MENNPLANRIEAYFFALEAPLSELPAPRREEFLREARAHVRSMVEARRADGMDELAAWDSSLANFGDPQEVGRALWREWASSGQLESEGAPLSMRDLARKYLPRMLLGMGIIAVGSIAMTRGWPGRYYAPFLVFLLLESFIRALLRHWRSGRQWTPFVLLSFSFFAFISLHLTANLLGEQSWRASAIGHLVDQCFPFVVCGFCGLGLYLYKRELPRRPWRFGPNAAYYEQSPVAAEQEYRLSPLIGFTMGASFGCVSLLVIGLQSFGIAPALWFGAASLVVGCGLALWLKK